MVKAAQRIVDSMKLDIDVRRQTSDYDFSKRQSIEIARACLVPRDVLSISAPLVLLDEPTSALEKSEEEALFRLIREHQRTRVGSLCVPSSWRGAKRVRHNTCLEGWSPRSNRHPS